MASKKFDKDTREYAMFFDFWRLCQAYWVPEDKDEYWQSAINSANGYTEKYGGDIFASEIAKAFLASLERRAKSDN